MWLCYEQGELDEFGGPVIKHCSDTGEPLTEFRSSSPDASPPDSPYVTWGDREIVVIKRPRFGRHVDYPSSIYPRTVYDWEGVPHQFSWLVKCDVCGRLGSDRWDSWNAFMGPDGDRIHYNAWRVLFGKDIDHICDACRVTHGSAASHIQKREDARRFVGYLDALSRYPEELRNRKMNEYAMDDDLRLLVNAQVAVIAARKQLKEAKKTFKEMNKNGI